jgi:hypothetical protein
MTLQDEAQSSREWKKNFGSKNAYLRAAANYALEPSCSGFKTSAGASLTASAWGWQQPLVELRANAEVDALAVSGRVNAEARLFGQSVVRTMS